MIKNKFVWLLLNIESLCVCFFKNRKIEADIISQGEKQMYLDGGFSQEKYATLLNAAFREEQEAMYELGMIWTITGTNHNDQERVLKGIEFVVKAADRGLAVAACYLGTIYHEGKYGIVVDMKKAVSYYKQGAEGGDALAMSNYGIALQGGDGGLQRDDVEAFSWLKRAADTDETLGVAQYNVALAYHAGRGTRTDRAMAKKYFQRAAKAGIGMAQVWLYSEDYNKL